MAYQIMSVAKLLGIPKNTLIAWERRYKIVTPARTAGGYRQYSDEDVATLKRLKAMINAGHRVGEACRLIKAEAQREPAAPASLPTGNEALGQIRAAMKESLLEFDRAGAERAALRLLMIPYEQTLEGVYFPLLHEIGEGWVSGEVTVVQEHFVSAYVREKLLVMSHSLGTPGPGAPKVVCSTPPGELHELGLIALSLRLTLRGFHVVYLGANVPTAEFCSYVVNNEVDVACITMVLKRSPDEFVRYAGELRRKLPPATRLAIGGRGVQMVLDQLPEIPGVEFVGTQTPGWLEDAAQFALSRRSHG